MASSRAKPKSLQLRDQVDYSVPKEDDEYRLEHFSMKFPKPRHLITNEYPDLEEVQLKFL
jgi:hypothetical protein